MMVLCDERSNPQLLKVGGYYRIAELTAETRVFLDSLSMTEKLIYSLVTYSIYLFIMKDEKCEHKMHESGAAAGAIYGLGFIGAAVYFIGKATTVWMGVLGFLKALVWPAFLVYGLFKYMGM